jgi:uncharacterized membrane protein YfcA
MGFFPLQDGLILLSLGLWAGILAGFLGIGGGTVIVPILVSLGHHPVEAVATSSLSIVITSLSGSLQNWRMGVLNFEEVITLGFPALVTAQVGVAIANLVSGRVLLMIFAGFLLLNMYLVEFRKQIITAQQAGQTLSEGQRSAKSEQQMMSDQSETLKDPAKPWNPLLWRLLTGGLAGGLAGLFGVGGGVILVPLQLLLLNTPMKQAIQTSLAVIVMTAIGATAGHAGLWPWLGNHLNLYAFWQTFPWPVTSHVLWLPGILLGCGGLVGVQVSTRLLPKLSDEVVSILFRMMLGILAVYVLWEALQSSS